MFQVSEMKQFRKQEMHLLFFNKPDSITMQTSFLLPPSKLNMYVQYNTLDCMCGLVPPIMKEAYATHYAHGRLVLVRIRTRTRVEVESLNGIGRYNILLCIQHEIRVCEGGGTRKLFLPGPKSLLDK
jgi:hypothetical protein